MTEKTDDGRMVQPIKSNEQLSHRSVNQIFTDCINPKTTPVLCQVLEGPEGGSVRQELLGMIRQFVPHRSPREEIKVVAKLVREINGTEVESPVVVRDISSSGAQIAISSRIGLSATDLAKVKLRLRIPDRDDTVVEARLARVIKSDGNFIQGGFQFVDLPEEVGAVLHTLKHVHTARTSEIARQRMSRAAPANQQDEPAERPLRISLGPRLK